MTNHHDDNAAAAPPVLGEHTVYVAFDVTATTRADAHRQVVDALRYRDTDRADTAVGRVLTERGVESWWLLEEDAKQYDRNDNQPAQVVY